MLAGVAKAGPPERVRSGQLVVLLDPGTHLFRVVARGYGDVSVTRTYAPGVKTRLDLTLSRLPATVRVTADVTQPIVTFDGADVGFAPVQISRPAGEYKVVVRKEGHDTFATKLVLSPGQETDLPANLPRERVPITKRWWFWTGVVAVVAGGALVTYALTREDPAPPPYSGGTSGWVVTPSR